MGFTAVLSACTMSGFAGCYLERVLQKGNTSLWIRNMQLGTWGFLLGLVSYIKKVDVRRCRRVMSCVAGRVSVKGVPTSTSIALIPTPSLSSLGLHGGEGWRWRGRTRIFPRVYPGGVGRHRHSGDGR